MIIAITTAPSHFSTSAAFYGFICRCLQHLAQQHPAYHFVVIGDRQDAIPAGSNTSFIFASPKGRSAIATRYWYDYQLPRIVKKQNADLWLALDGACSLRSRVPQLLFMSDTRFLQKTSPLPRKQSSFYRNRTAAALTKAAAVITPSEFSKKQLIETYGQAQEKITVCYPVPGPLFHAVSWEQKEIIKEKYADGKEYFLFPGAIDPASNLHLLLKAFSLFKKRQKTNMLLLIAGPVTVGYTQFTEDLRTYKFRNEVKLTGNLPVEEMASVTAGAYALVLPLTYRDHALPVWEAMQCEVPVLAGNNSAFPELGGDAALYADTADMNDMAQHMMLLFKDESERDRLIQAGREQVREHYMTNAAGILNRLILQAVNG
jgi:glycosyltransferase involved in cell wall biosynthesis